MHNGIRWRANNVDVVSARSLAGDSETGATSGNEADRGVAPLVRKREDADLVSSPSSGNSANATGSGVSWTPVARKREDAHLVSLSLPPLDAVASPGATFWSSGSDEGSTTDVSPTFGPPESPDVENMVVGDAVGIPAGSALAQIAVLDSARGALCPSATVHVDGLRGEFSNDETGVTAGSSEETDKNPHDKLCYPVAAGGGGGGEDLTCRRRHGAAVLPHKLETTFLPQHHLPASFNRDEATSGGQVSLSDFCHGATEVLPSSSKSLLNSRETSPPHHLTAEFSQDEVASGEHPGLCDFIGRGSVVAAPTASQLTGNADPTTTTDGRPRGQMRRGIDDSDLPNGRNWVDALACGERHADHVSVRLRGLIDGGECSSQTIDRNESSLEQIDRLLGRGASSGCHGGAASLDQEILPLVPMDDAIAGVYYRSIDDLPEVGTDGCGASLNTKEAPLTSLTNDWLCNPNQSLSTTQHQSEDQQGVDAKKGMECARDWASRDASLDDGAGCRHVHDDDTEVDGCRRQSIDSKKIKERLENTRIHIGNGVLDIRRLCAVAKSSSGGKAGEQDKQPRGCSDDGVSYGPCTGSEGVGDVCAAAALISYDEDVNKDGCEYPVASGPASSVHMGTMPRLVPVEACGAGLVNDAESKRSISPSGRSLTPSIKDTTLAPQLKNNSNCAEREVEHVAQPLGVDEDTLLPASVKKITRWLRGVHADGGHDTFSASTCVQQQQQKIDFVDAKEAANEADTADSVRGEAGDAAVFYDGDVNGKEAEAPSGDCDESTIIRAVVQEIVHAICAGNAAGGVKGEDSSGSGRVGVSALLEETTSSI